MAGNGSGGGTGNTVDAPIGFTLDVSNRLYVAEHFGQRISRWVQGATNGTIIAQSSTPTCATPPISFCFPADVIVEPDESIYFTQRWSDRLHFWPKGASSVVLVAGKSFDRVSRCSSD